MCNDPLTAEDANLVKIIDLFGIPRMMATDDQSDVEQPQEPYAVVIAAQRLAYAMQDNRGPANALPPWIKQASAVYVYDFQCNDQSRKLLEFLTGDSRVKITTLQKTHTTMSITGDFPEMCGPMSGMRVPVSTHIPGIVCEIAASVTGFRSIIRTDQGELFFSTTCSGVPVFINTWGRTIDISAHSAKYFDVRTSFPETVPTIFYLQWAFRATAWTRHRTNACLIVDDPPLKRRYGFLDYAEALQLMHRHNFTTTIAFIPWNWRRTHPQTLSMFQNEPGRFSVVVHGCDHTTSEFAARSATLLNQKIQNSRRRMESLRSKAWIKADRIMVFPQGEFSPEAGRALKLNNFAAAVNTEVAPAPPAANETTIADLWKIAITKYAAFPIFTRRYPEHGIENFAFDALLGKPCLIAAHHDLFRNHARDLIDLITRLNSLKWNLVWRPLGETLGRSFGIRLHEDASVIEIFANSTVLENPFTHASRMLLVKEESDSDCVEAVLVNQRRVEFQFDDKYLRVLLTMFPREAVRIQVVYRNRLEPVKRMTDFEGRIRVAAQRYLSEFRDNYLSRSEFLYNSANKLHRLTK